MNSLTNEYRLGDRLDEQKTERKGERDRGGNRERERERERERRGGGNVLEMTNTAYLIGFPQIYFGATKMSKTGRMKGRKYRS